MQEYPQEPKMTTLAELLDEAMADIVAGSPRFKEDEHNYRRGYHQGITTLLDGVLTLLREGATPDEMGHLCMEFEDDVARWRQEEIGVLPAFIAPKFFVSSYRARLQSRSEGKSDG